MSKTKLQIPEETQRYLDFLRYSIDDECPVPASIDKLDWQGLYDFAVKQAIIGVIYHGIKRLPAGVPRPDTDLELTWFGMAEVIRKRNMQLNMVAAKFTRDLAKAGFQSCILKGQGNALMYPDPYMRSPGDIDVWLDGTREEIIDFAKKGVDNPEILYHHVSYPIIKDLDIELHFFPSFMLNPWNNARIQRFFLSDKDAQFVNFQSLPDNAGQISVPKDGFNIVFQLSHMLRHYLKGGLGLRHLLDFYMLLRKNNQMSLLEKSVILCEEFGFGKFPKAVLFLESELLGLAFMEPKNEKAGLKLLSDMLEEGNLGKSNKNNDVRRLSIPKVKRLLHVAELSYSEAPFIHGSCIWRKIIIKV